MGEVRVTVPVKVPAWVRFCVLRLTLMVAGVVLPVAVAASQSFGRKFPQLDELLDTNKELPIEEWPDKPRRWLENGLLNRILSFIARATDEKWALDLAIYEYELKAIVDAGRD